ncbi:MAG TPA: aldo/keto reductase [Anaerolineae bacterium]|nr:aldo/keto reductase [Anaerolineae bacterium]
MANQIETISLGKTDVKVTPLGLGAWQWGDRFMWQYGNGYNDRDVHDAFKVSLDASINWIDTAELYGSGTSERLLGQFMHELNVQPLVATKFLPLPWRVRQGSLVDALKRSLNRLNLSKVDLYQIHFLLPFRSVETWANGLADALDAGLTRAVGVSNYNVEKTLKTVNVLAKRGKVLASNQVEYSLLNRSIERSGLIDLCRELEITVIAYSPIGKGLLSGKYTPDHLPPGRRGRKYNRAYLIKIQPLIDLIKQIGQGHGGKTPAQIALNWVLCKGAVAIPGAKNGMQAHENAGALGWRLTNDEVSRLDEASDQ